MSVPIKLFNSVNYLSVFEVVIKSIKSLVESLLSAKTNTMSRQEHEEGMRNRIIKVARRLFVEQGYHKTTVRQILAAANVKTGTLYHFYKNKEDILYQVVRETFFRTQKHTEKLVGKNDKILHLACEMAWHIHLMALHAPSAELYLMSYNSPKIAGNLIEEQGFRSQDIFKSYTDNLSSLDHEMRAMMTKGFMQSVAQRAVQGKLLNSDLVVEYGVDLCFSLFGLSKKEINNLLGELQYINIESHVRATLSH